MYLLLPTASQSDLFDVMINIAFWGKLLQVLLMIREQCSTDIFFMDWEKPRATDTEAAAPIR